MNELNIYYEIPKKYEHAIFIGLKKWIKIFFYNFYGYQNGDPGSNNMARIKIFTLITSFFLLKGLDPARLYHIIRIQSLMKMYVFFNFLDLCDKLITTVILDSVALIDENFKNKENKKTKISSYTGCILFILLTLIHSSIMYIHFVSLHVCANSHASVLYALLISNNFVELRTAITKKYDKNSLMVLFENDLTKRFQNFVFLGLILVYNIIENCDLKISILLFPLIIIWLSKIIVEALKHAFICRYNSLGQMIYETDTNYQSSQYLALNIVTACVCWNIFKFIDKYRWIALIFPIIKFIKI